MENCILVLELLVTRATRYCRSNTFIVSKLSTLGRIWARYLTAIFNAPIFVDAFTVTGTVFQSHRIRSIRDGSQGSDIAWLSPATNICVWCGCGCDGFGELGSQTEQQEVGKHHKS
jgi:hypothetical protein